MFHLHHFSLLLDRNSSTSAGDPAQGQPGGAGETPQGGHDRPQRRPGEAGREAARAQRRPRPVQRGHGREAAADGRRRDVPPQNGDGQRSDPRAGRRAGALDRAEQGVQGADRAPCRRHRHLHGLPLLPGEMLLLFLLFNKPN